MEPVSTRTAARDEAVAQHQKRVAAFALELGRSLKLNDEEMDLLDIAAGFYEIPMQLFTPEAESRLLRDVLGREYPLSSGREFFPEKVRAVISGLQGLAPAAECCRVMDILWIADALEERLEAEPYFGLPEETEESLCQVALAQLRKASRKDLRRVVPLLPAFPAAALRAVTELVNPDLDNRDLERIAKSDPVMAGRLINTANSALFAMHNPVRNLIRAITQMGSTLTTKVLLATALRPAFATATSQALWVHALESADASAALAQRARKIEPMEAALAGLMHDVGMLAFSMIGADAEAACSRLMERGCQRRAAETTVFGFDHAEAGAEILNAWKFPKDVIDGVRGHHTPEQGDSPLAAILYLAEFLTGAEEDRPSAARLQAAGDRVGLTLADIVLLKTPGELTAAFSA
jgi:putative nucleotidyltransferase with HDIG domain